MCENVCTLLDWTFCCINKNKSKNIINKLGNRSTWKKEEESTSKPIITSMSSSRPNFFLIRGKNQETLLEPKDPNFD